MAVDRKGATEVGSLITDAPPNPGNKTDYGWTPWMAPLTVAAFAWIPAVLIAHYVAVWTLAATLPMLVAALLVFWRHQRNLPGVTSWWQR